MPFGILGEIWSTVTVCLSVIAFCTGDISGTERRRELILGLLERSEPVDVPFGIFGQIFNEELYKVINKI